MVIILTIYSGNGDIGDDNDNNDNISNGNDNREI